MFSSVAYLDMDKLVMAGHSFGGSTTINVANSDPRVKCMFTQDAWLRPLINEIEDTKYQNFRSEMPC